MAEIINKEHKNVPPDKLREHPANPRQGDVGAIYESIKENGFYGTIVVQKSTGYVLAGNHRLKAAKEVGLDTVPVVYVDVDDERAMRILLADNRTNDLATYDDTALSQLLEHLASTDDGLAGTGYDGDYLDDLLRGLSDEEPKDAEAQVDRAEELKDEWQTETGQIWLIPSADGNRVHRLMCGDSTSEDDVGRLLDGATPNLMVTDPPYGVNYDPNWRNEAAEAGLLSYSAIRIGKVTNDDRVDWSDAYRLFPGNVAYTWSPPGDHVILTGQVLQGIGFDIRNQIIWVKSHFPISRGAYTYQHEPVWYGVRKGCVSDFIGPKNESTKWEINLDKNVDGGHSTQKPLECMQRPIRNHRGDVYEPFAGSGTTIVAAENERRTCYAMEIDPGYVAVCLERLKGIGLQPELLKHSCA